MPSFQIYFDGPFGDEPSNDLGEKLQERINQDHDNWAVYFNYTRTPTSNASHYVGLSVTGGTDAEVESPEFRADLEVELRGLIDDIDDDDEIQIEHVRYTWWY